MKRFLFGALSVGMVIYTFAIPAKPGFIRYTQPDGTEVEIKIFGDEFGHIAYSADGMVVVNVSDRMEYAVFDESGMAKPSGLMVSDDSQVPEEVKIQQTLEKIKKWEQIVERHRNQRVALLNLRKTDETTTDISEPEENGNGTDNDDQNIADPDDMLTDSERTVPANFGRCASTFPVIGEQKGLVLLVEYQDVGFKYGDYDYFSRMLNEEGFSDYGSLGSAKDWFVENSNGIFVPEFDVFGPVKLPENRSYYGSNDAYGNDKNPHQMVIHACDILDEEIDFTQYDRDGDGKIDNIFVFYAGKGEHDTNISSAVWPHSWNVSEADPDSTYMFDGVILDHYACSCEYPNGYSRPDGIGTFVHEFSHVIGLPDLYVTSYSSGFTPGPYSVLDYGPYNNDRLTPPNYSSFEKCALGWIEMLPMEEGRIELPSLIESNKAYYLPTERANEFYFFENRQLEGNDTYIPYHGMLVWRIDYNKKFWDNNTVNNTSSHQRVDLIEADNKKTANTRNGDPFPGAENVTEFTFETKPKLSSWQNAALEFDIKNIEETEDGLIMFEALSRKSEGESKVLIAVDEVVVEKEYYDLTGRKVKKPEAGIYIVDGKKIILLNNAGLRK